MKDVTAAVAFAEREDIPLPATVRDRVAALDLASEVYADIPGLGVRKKFQGSTYEGDIYYTLPVTQTEYDQLLAALGAEEEPV